MKSEWSMALQRGMVKKKKHKKNCPCQGQHYFSKHKAQKLILPSIGHIKIHQWFAISEYAAVMLFEARIEENKVHSNHA